MEEQEQPDETDVVRSFGWTVSRARHMWHIHHAPLDKLLNYLKAEPIPDTVPPEWTQPPSAPV